VNTARAERRIKRASQRERAFRALTPTAASAVPDIVVQAAALWLHGGKANAASLHAALMAGVAKAQEPAALTMLEILVQHASEHADYLSDEMRCAYLAAALLGPGAVDSLLLSVLPCREAAELRPVLEQAELDIKRAYVPCAWPGGEGGTQTTALYLKTHSINGSEHAVAAVMRAFFCFRAWESLVTTPDLLTNLVSGDDSTFHKALVRLEKAGCRIFKRRYQGTSAGPHVVAMLARLDWASLCADDAASIDADDANARVSDTDVGGGRAPLWSTIVDRLIVAARGGVGKFLGTKMLLQLVLYGAAPSLTDDEAALGPGALVGLWSVYNLMMTGSYVPSYQVKPSEVEQCAFNAEVKAASMALSGATDCATAAPPSGGNATADAIAAAAARAAAATAAAGVHRAMTESFSSKQWLLHTSKMLKVSMNAYWRQRIADEAVLQVLDEPMTAYLQVDLCTVVVESFLCEVLRRRNVGLEFAREEGCVKSLPKGKFTEIQEFLAAATADGALSVWDRLVLVNVNGVISCMPLYAIREA